MCPKLIELLSWNGPTVHVCCFMLARASTKTFVNRIHIRQPNPKKQRKKSSLAEKFVSRVTRQPRYHCMYKFNRCQLRQLSAQHDLLGNLSTLHSEWKIGCFTSGGMDNNRGQGAFFSGRDFFRDFPQPFLANAETVNNSFFPRYVLYV